MNKRIQKKIAKRWGRRRYDTYKLAYYNATHYEVVELQPSAEYISNLLALIDSIQAYKDKLGIKEL